MVSPVALYRQAAGQSFRRRDHIRVLASCPHGEYDQGDDRMGLFQPYDDRLQSRHIYVHAPTANTRAGQTGGCRPGRCIFHRVDRDVREPDGGTVVVAKQGTVVAREGDGDIHLSYGRRMFVDVAAYDVCLPVCFFVLRRSSVRSRSANGRASDTERAVAGLPGLLLFLLRDRDDLPGLRYRDLLQVDTPRGAGAWHAFLPFYYGYRRFDDQFHRI